MRFPGADFSDDQKAGAVAGVVLLGELASGKMSQRERRMRPGEVGREAREFAVFISFWNPGRRQQSLTALLQAAIATRHPAVFYGVGLSRERLPTRALAQRADLRRCFRQHPILLSIS